MKTIFAILPLLLSAFSANAATIITPNTPTGNVSPNAGSSYLSLVDSSSLSATVTTGMDTATALIVTATTSSAAATYVTPSQGGGNNYFSTGGTPPELTFALGGTYDNIDSILVWNYYLVANSATEFSLAFYSDAAASVQIGSTLTGLGLSVGGNPTNAQQVFFGSGVDFDGVQAIKMILTANNGATSSNRVGINEVRFSQQAVPEPSRVVFLGLASLGLILRRRR